MDDFGRLDVFLLDADMDFSGSHGIFEVFKEKLSCQTGTGCEVAAIFGVMEG